MAELYDLDQSLIEIAGKTTTAHWTVRHAVEGVQIFGGIGSGKTSGSGRLLALKYLKAGFGGLVLTAKPDEKTLWQDYCRLAGRERDLLVLEPNGVHCFNFLEYESSQTVDGEAAITDNIVEVLKTVIRAGAEKDGGKADDSFWEQALDMLIFNTIDLCRLAYDRVTVPDMYEIAATVPKKPEDLKVKPGEAKPFHKAFEAARDKVNNLVDIWEGTFTAKQKAEMEASQTIDGVPFEQAMLEAVPDARLLRFLDQFFNETLLNLADKTRSVIDFSLAGFLFRLLREPVYSLFCRYGSTFTPTDSLRGKIILLNIPVKLYHKVGRDCQVLFKYIWQRAMERRDVNTNSRPVFLWADEAQHFLHEHDAEYQATARSSRIATVYISQNLPNYYASMGGNKSDHRVMSFLGTLGTKIFHANADISTNDYGSELIGDGPYEDISRSVNIGKEHSESQSISIKHDRRVRPPEFVRLSTGGPQNNFKVEGMMHRQGDALFGSSNYKKMSFNQKYSP